MHSERAIKKNIGTMSVGKKIFQTVRMKCLSIILLSWPDDFIDIFYIIIQYELGNVTRTEASKGRS